MTAMAPAATPGRRLVIACVFTSHEVPPGLPQPPVHGVGSFEPPAEVSGFCGGVAFSIVCWDAVGPSRQAIAGSVASRLELQRRAATGESMKRILSAIAVVVVIFFLFRFVVPSYAPPSASAPPGARPAPALAASTAATDEGLTGAWITGRVTGPGHLPIAGADVCAYARSTRLTTASLGPRCVTSSADGAYRLLDLAPATYRVVASADGFLPGEWRQGDESLFGLRAGEGRETTDLELARGGLELRGRVKDITGGVVPRARVTVGRDRFLPEGVGITDSNGDFRLWAASGRRIVTAEADGYNTVQATAIVPGRRLEITLVPESVLVGRVVEAGSGNPVPGARVVANGEGVDVQTVAMTDADGRFRLRGLTPGRYKPVGNTERAWGTTPESVALGLVETAEVRIVLHPAHSVRGRVVGPEGKGCPNATVSLQDRRSGDEREGEGSPEGDVRIDGVLPGTLKVDVRCPGAVAAGVYEDLVVEAGSIAGVIWRVDSGLAVRGTVVTSSGTGAAHAEVRARRTAGSPLEAADVAAWTDADGRYVLRGLRRGSYELTVESELGAPPEPRLVVAVDRDLEAVRVVLRDAALLEGFVVDSHGEPADVDVDVRAHDEPTRRRRTHTRDDGSFAFRSLPAGAYHVTADGVRAPGAADDAPPGVDITARVGVTTNVRIRIETRNGTIRGRVTDERGDAVTDAFVDAEREPDREGAAKGRGRAALRWSWGHRSPVMTDNDGAFTLRGLPSGSYTVRAFRKGGGDTLHEGVRVGSDVALVLRPEGSLAGTIANPDGSAPERFEINVRDAKRSFNRSEAFFRTAGRWRMSGLPEGDFAVTGTSAEGRAFAEVHVGPAEQRANVALRSEATGALKGRLVALDTGAPVEGMIVVPFPAKGGGLGNAFELERRIVSDADGRFEIARAPPGNVVVRTFGAQGRNEYASATVGATVIPGGETSLPVLRVPRSRLSGSVAGDLGFATQEPALGDDPLAVTYGHVVMVRPGSDAATGGLVVGDEIVAVDGYSVEGANGYLYPALTRVSPGTKLVLLLRRGGSLHVTATSARR